MIRSGIVAVLAPPPIDFDKLLKFWAVENPLVFVKFYLSSLLTPRCTLDSPGTSCSSNQGTGTGVPGVQTLSTPKMH